MNKFLLFVVSAFLLFANCGKVKGDPEILELINKVVANCNVDTRYTFLKECKEEADKNLSKTIKSKGPGASLASLAIALNDEKIEVSATAASMLYQEIKDNMKEVNENPKLVDDKVLDLFLKGMEKYKKEYFPFYAVRSIVHLAMIKGKKDKIIPFLKTHPEKAVQSEGLSYLMQYGRLGAFKEVKELAKENEMVRIALNNPRNMYSITADEEKEICTWAAEFLENADAQISGSAAITVATRCKGEFIDKVLDKAEKLAADGKLESAFRSSLTNFTFSCQAFLGSSPTGTPEQCERKAKILESAK